jgi:CRP-like cAMP-binding protein
MANTIATEQTRAALVEMAQVWRRLAESHDVRSAMQQQQQQQIQLKNDKKE